MPIYEFRCKDCGNVSEFQMKMSDPNPEVCPTCGHPALTKIMSLPSFQLKGGGWYSDAYDGKSNKAGSSKGAESPNSEAAPAPAAAAPAATPAAPSAAPAAGSGSSSSSSSSGSSSGSTPSGSSNK
ncbi:MAG: zinc ribbon domain-containing protein [Proteobacteria bacterium]|nr:MAG: zinc ribbon domain-containing protein [Pseudomonadota bacterium]